jgi:hypothetical protein
MEQASNNTDKQERKRNALHEKLGEIKRLAEEAQTEAKDVLPQQDSEALNWLLGDVITRAVKAEEKVEEHF